jgi:hypothetical protein
MKKILLSLFLSVLCCFGCRKSALKLENPATTSGIFYTNSKPGLYLIELIGVGSRSVYYGIISPGSTGVMLSFPTKVAAGCYDVVLSPEGSVAKTTTVYTIGGKSGSTAVYPLILHNVFLPADNSGAVSITVR